MLLKMIRIFKVLNIKYKLLYIALFIAVLAALFDGLTIGFLIPILNGFINKGDFSNVRDIQIIDKIFYGIGVNSQTEIFLLLCFVMLISTYLFHVMRYWNQMILQKFIRNMETILRENILEKWISLSKSLRNMLFSGEFNYFMDKVQNARMLMENVNIIFVHLGVSFIYLFIMLCISWKLSCGVLAMLFVLIYVAKIMDKVMGKTAMRHEDYSKEYIGKTMDIVLNYELIGSASIQSREFDEYRKMNRDLSECKYRHEMFLAKIPLIHGIIVITVTVLIIVTSAYYYIQSRDLYLAAYIMYFVILFKFIDNSRKVRQYSSRIISQAYAMHSLEWLITQERQRWPGTKELKEYKKNISFQNVSFGYARSLTVLRNITLTIHCASRVAIVGNTAMGKTTLMNLMLGLYDCESGHIEVDGIDLKEYDIVSWRNHIGYVMSRVQLLHRSIKDNITFGVNREVSREELESVVRIVILDEYIQALPQNYDTIIGDQGVTLSGGQRQKLMMARMILKNPSIMIFDEATNAIDVSTEKNIHNNLRNKFPDATMIIITHRLASILDVDWIYVLDQGSVAEEGTSESLMAQKGAFWKMMQGASQNPA